jgi:hypothetical protein
MRKERRERMEREKVVKVITVGGRRKVFCTG